MQQRNGILAIGNLLVDRALLISDYPQESMLATISNMELHCGGGCTNVLFNLAKLDPRLPLFLAGAIGQDGEGQLILQQAKQHHINVDNVVQLALPTSFTDVMINSQTGDRTFFHYVGAMAEYQAEHILQIDHPAKIAHIAYLPLLPKLLDVEVLKHTLTSLQQKGFLISIDLVSVANKQIFTQQILPILPYVDYVIINDIEAKWLTNSEAFASSKTVLQRMAEQMMVLGVRNTVIIHEPKWAVAMNQQGEQVAIPSYWVEKQNIVSTLGAGDAFCTGVLYGLHHGLPLVEVLKLGHGLAYFNLFSMSATGGAVSYETMQHFITTQESNR
ncbi:TPA: carbohydrate kinase family protein [Pasteurella multocida]|uniref:Adenosine kinase n=1 Tax=Pasteurella multocida TaxID=747 RepID=A0A849CM33_PASMD|nr:carbohydrate kinase family protein [Pasteurella multocida]AFI46794.1 kinase, PfkB family [Pasteurella multocida subsp. multocida str. 3480]AWW53446.1 carbohydrate kinase family protein [Pasteurella multocida]EPE71622.1 kinase, PfkB family protein [Pasteurella multocida 671/90]MCH1905134.1 carbohydrate kinase family protein [Pasteurella multocida]MCL7769145.1 carbohydrate kinase family protein [Pasteurella multocida]